MKSSASWSIANVVYKADEYPQLKDFYQKVNAKDKEPAVFQFTSGSIHCIGLAMKLPIITDGLSLAVPAAHAA